MAPEHAIAVGLGLVAFAAPVTAAIIRKNGGGNKFVRMETFSVFADAVESRLDQIYQEIQELRKEVRQ